MMVAGDNTENRKEKFKESKKRCQWKLSPLLVLKYIG